MNNTSSDTSKINCGVPQGSILGPLLFLVYVNDLPNVVKDNKIILFADDTNVFIFAKKLSDLNSISNDCIRKMQIWFRSNLLSVNVTKTNYMFFNESKAVSTDDKLRLLLNGIPINKVDECVYLGATIDNHLNWKSHVDAIYNKIIRFTGIFYKLRAVLPFKCLRMLYFSLVHSHILYAIEVYGSVEKSTLQRLTVLDNRIIRTILYEKMECPVSELHRRMDTIPVPILYQYRLLLLMHKYVHTNHLLPGIFSNYFQQNSAIHSHNTRSNNQFHINSIKSHFGKKSFSYQGCTLWNSLPELYKNITCCHHFKNEIKKYLFNQYFAN